MAESFYEDQNLGEIGWKVMISREPEDSTTTGSVPDESGSLPSPRRLKRHLPVDLQHHHLTCRHQQPQEVLQRIRREPD